MKDIKYFQEKIKEKRRKTSFRDFLKEITSWMPYSFNKNNWMISRFPESSRINVVSNKDFNSIRDDLSRWGLQYDFSKDFFKNLQKLFVKTKIPWIFHYWENENCDYADVVLYCKNAYLSSIMIWNCENVFYSILTRTNSTNIFNSIFSVENCDSVYNSSWTINSFNIFYSKYINNCNNCWFSSNLIWCSECIFCNELENVSYAINNKVYSKEYYKNKKEEILKEKNRFLEYYKNVDKYWKNYASTNVRWSFILESEDLENCFYAYNSKNARNSFFIWSIWWSENFFDVCPWWWWEKYNSDFYAINWAWDWSNNLYCCSQIWSSSNIFYSYFLESCSYCIWCIGLKNKSYCILNKQYSKEEWKSLAIKIFSQMEQGGTLWEFFPWSLSPFYFNDTMAYLLDDSFTKEEVEKDWYMWRDEEIKIDIPENAEVVFTCHSELDSESLENKNFNSMKDPEINSGWQTLDYYQGFDENWKWYINPEILKKVIKDSNWNYYRIVKMEYNFLMKHWLPLPEIHRLDRIKLGFKFK